MTTIPEIPPEGLPLPGAPRYLLRRLLGRGGFGDAYLADDTALARRVVVKLLMNLTEPTIRERFSREARIAANIHHPNVVQVHDIGAMPDGRPFFVMEFVDGMSLTDFIKARGSSLSLSHALTLLAEAAEGLAAAHRMEVVHRDIKPDNLLVTSDGHTKLIDFGIAKKAVQDAENATVKQTSVGTVLGTPRYISPEQATAKVLAGASDLYSLGCVMYALLTGRSPFDGSPQELMMHHVYTPAPTLAAAASGRTFPVEVEGIVARLLTKDPLRRHASGDALAKELRKCAALARANEETDSTVALPSLPGDPTLKDPAIAAAATMSNVHSAGGLAPAPGLWDGATDDLSQLGMSPPPAPNSHGPRAWGSGEGERTTALGAPERGAVGKDSSVSTPLQAMGDLTGRIEPTPRGSRAAWVAGVVVLLASAIGGTAFFMSRSRSGTGGRDNSTPTSTAPKSEPSEPKPAQPMATTESTPTIPTSSTSVDGTATASAKIPVAPHAQIPKTAAAPAMAKIPATGSAKPTAGAAATVQPTTVAPTGASKPQPTTASPPPPPNTSTAIDDRT